MSQTMQAVFNGTVIAENDDTVVVEGNHYFPRESLRSEYFVPTGTRSLCPWKGVASYLDVRVDGVAGPDAAWRYEHPFVLAHRIAGRVAFWRGVIVQPAPEHERTAPGGAGPDAPGPGGAP